MHQMSPGVERAVQAARTWAERLGSTEIRLNHYVLALLDEEEGRPAMLIERAGVAADAVRKALQTQADAPPALDEPSLFNAARSWSIAYRHDPEFLTDALLIVVLRADPTFEKMAAAIGLNCSRLEEILTLRPQVESEPFAPLGEESLAVFTHGDVSGEVDAARVLDVNLNRAREALRVLEDYCRFVLNDHFLTEELKEMRHGLAAVNNSISPELLVKSRETLTDVGTTISAAREYERDSPAQVALANGKRLQESLRSLEEFGKIFAPDIGKIAEALRYRAYTLEKALGVRSQGHSILSAAKLYVLLTGSQCRASLDWTIEQAAAGGVEIVQLREKSLPDRGLLARARDVRRWTRKAGVLFIVNDRPDIARLSEADGVHLGQDDLSVQESRRILGGEAIIGVSTHSIEQLRRAVLDGADYVGIGPVFPSSTKEFDHLVGLEFIRAAVTETSIPAFALGGIGPANIHRVIEAGASRVAIGAAIATAEDPGAVSRHLRRALTQNL